MNDELLLDQLQFSRNNVLRHLESVNEKNSIRIPDGYNNSVLWNVGHILLAMEDALFKATGRKFMLPEQYRFLFDGGTKPKEWTVELPSLTLLIEQLRDQTDRVRQTFKGQLKEELPTVIHFSGLPPLTTVAENLSLALLHEGQHIGYIMAIKHSLA
jgi:hypothetical protein